MIRYAADPMMSVVLFEMKSEEGIQELGNVPAVEQSEQDLEERPVNLIRYAFIRELGRGGLSTVWLARDKELGRDVAIKKMRASYRHREDLRRRFLREASILAKLRHPNFVAIYDVSSHGETPYIIQELLLAPTLSSRRREQLMLPDEAARLLATLARAMEFAHSLGIIHRDLKPDNILLTEDGTPKIIDFGLAREMRDVDEDVGATPEKREVDEVAGSIPRGGYIMGTPLYMAPEQARGDIQRVGPASDIYSLGATLYEVLTGRRPFTGESLKTIFEEVRERAPAPPSRLNPRVPRNLEAICLKCLEKEPEKRYSTAAALAEDLERFLKGQPVLARPQTIWDRVRHLLTLKWVAGRRRTAGR
jgi:serine/threonine protein kinase